MTYPTANKKLIEWVEDVAKLTTPDRIQWCDGSAREYDELCQLLVDNGTFTKLSEAKRPNSYYATSDPGDVARVEDRTYICSAKEIDEGAHDVRRALLDGPPRFEHLTHRRRDHRLGLRGGVDAHHDPHGRGRARSPRRGRRLRALPALGGHAPRRGPGRREVALRRREQVHRALPRHPRDHLVRLGLRRQRAARQEVLRAAHRVGARARRGLVRRAHADPEADQPRGRVTLRRGRLPERVRQDEPRDARAVAARLEGRDHR